MYRESDLDAQMPAYLKRIAGFLEEDMGRDRSRPYENDGANGVYRNVPNVARILEDKYGSRLPIVISGQGEDVVGEVEDGRLAVARDSSDIATMHLVLDRWEEVIDERGGAIFQPGESSYMLMVFEGADIAASTMSSESPYRETFLERYKRILPLREDPLGGIRFTGKLTISPDVGVTFTYTPLFVPPGIPDPMEYMEKQKSFLPGYLVGNAYRDPKILDIARRGRAIY
jgi:hypothetical protein